MPAAPANRIARAERRLAALYALSKQLSSYRGPEQSLPSMLRSLNDALPLASAILIEGRSGRLTKLVWHPAAAPPGALLRAETNALAGYAFLAGPLPASPRPLEVRRVPLDFLERRLSSRVMEEQGRRNFILLPLAIGRGAIFGALQVEGADPLDEGDLAFVDAVVHQLAIAIDRHYQASGRVQA